MCCSCVYLVLLFRCLIVLVWVFGFVIVMLFCLMRCFLVLTFTSSCWLISVASLLVFGKLIVLYDVLVCSFGMVCLLFYCLLEPYWFCSVCFAWLC